MDTRSTGDISDWLSVQDDEILGSVSDGELSDEDGLPFEDGDDDEEWDAWERDGAVQEQTLSDEEREDERINTELESYSWHEVSTMTYDIEEPAGYLHLFAIVVTKSESDIGSRGRAAVFQDEDEMKGANRCHEKLVRFWKRHRFELDRMDRKDAWMSLLRLRMLVRKRDTSMTVASKFPWLLRFSAESIPIHSYSVSQLGNALFLLAKAVTILSYHEDMHRYADVLLDRCAILSSLTRTTAPSEIAAKRGDRILDDTSLCSISEDATLWYPNDSFFDSMECRFFHVFHRLALHEDWPESRRVSVGRSTHGELFRWTRGILRAIHTIQMRDDLADRMDKHMYPAQLFPGEEENYKRLKPWMRAKAYTVLDEFRRSEMNQLSGIVNSGLIEDLVYVARPSVCSRDMVEAEVREQVLAKERFQNIQGLSTQTLELITGKQAGDDLEVIVGLTDQDDEGEGGGGVNACDAWLDNVLKEVPPCLRIAYNQLIICIIEELFRRQCEGVPFLELFALTRDPELSPLQRRPYYLARERAWPVLVQTSSAHHHLAVAGTLYVFEDIEGAIAAWFRCMLACLERKEVANVQPLPRCQVGIHSISRLLWGDDTLNAPQQHHEENGSGKSFTCHDFVMT